MIKLQTISPGLLNPGSMDILGQIIICCEDLSSVF